MKKQELKDITKKITKEQQQHLRDFAEAHKLSVDIVPGNPNYYHKNEMFLSLEIWKLDDEEYDHLIRVINNLKTEYAYARDSFWFLISKED